MTWKTVRLELARTPDFPEGSARHVYVLHLPLGEDGIIDESEFRQAPGRAILHRTWPNEADQNGLIIRKRGGWAFSYEPGDDDDEAIFHLENHPIRPGEYLTITETDGDRLPFRVVSCQPLP